jgi:predicted hotdog family 3-hydroxylacyl-ACP dehydratase
MCLLDEVLEWDEVRAQCRSSTHRSADNPLRAHGRLGASCGIEYAAQTMAVHGALIAERAGTAAPRGFLASVRNVDLRVWRLDEIESDLIASVVRITGDEGTALYEFSLCTAAAESGIGVGARVEPGIGVAAAAGFAEAGAGGVEAGAGVGAGIVLLTGRAAIAFNILGGARRPAG